MFLGDLVRRERRRSPPHDEPPERARHRVPPEDEEEEDLVARGHDHHAQHHDEQRPERTPPGEVELLEASVPERRDYQQGRHVRPDRDRQEEPGGELDPLEQDHCGYYQPSRGGCRQPDEEPAVDGPRVDVEAREPEGSADHEQERAESRQCEPQDVAGLGPRRPRRADDQVAGSVKRRHHAERAAHVRSPRTVTPPVTRSPTRTRTSVPRGITQSVREPKRIMPKRSPAASLSPGPTRQTIRRATAPAIWTTVTRAVSPCRWSVQRSFAPSASDR